MKTNKKRIVAIFAPILVFGIILFVWAGKKRPVLSEQERFAMEALPGYFFVFEGKTNHIVRAKSHDAFLDQHPMMPYLELVADRLEKRPWARDFAIRIQETETQVVISLPSWAEQRGMTRPGVFHSGYSLQVTIDKKTMKIVSAYQG